MEYADLTKALFKVEQFLATQVNMSFPPARKVWPSPYRFSRNLQMPNSIVCRSLTPNLAQIGQKIWKLG